MNNKINDEFVTVMCNVTKDNYKEYIGKKINVEGDVNLEKLKLEELPITFGYVTGFFWCGCNKLTSLEGSPKKVGRDFACNGNKLTSLEYAPKEVGGSFQCSANDITTLEYSPKEVGGSFNCSLNKLINLEGCPKMVGKDFYCFWNNHRFMKIYVEEMSTVKGSIYV